MRAVVCRRFAPVSALELVDSFEEPQPDDDEVLIEADIVLDPQRDTGPHAFVLRQLGENSSEPLQVRVSLQLTKAGTETVTVRSVSPFNAAVREFMRLGVEYVGP